MLHVSWPFYTLNVRVCVCFRCHGHDIHLDTYTLNEIATPLIVSRLLKQLWRGTIEGNVLRWWAWQRSQRQPGVRVRKNVLGHCYPVHLVVFLLLLLLLNLLMHVHTIYVPTYVAILNLWFVHTCIRTYIHTHLRHHSFHQAMLLTVVREHQEFWRVGCS